MIRTVTHKYLKRQFENFEKTEEVDDLLAELQFSTLILPISMENGSFNFPAVSFEDENYAPVFTDIYEYDKLNFSDDFIPVANDFDFYMNLLEEDVDGIVVDIEGERFPITVEFKEFIKSNYTDSNPKILTLKEIKQIKNSINNQDLEEFLKDESNFWDFETLMNLLSKSDIFKVVLSENDLSDMADDGVISLEGIDELPSAMLSKFSESYALIYTKESEVKPKNNLMHPYLQLVNFPEFINRILLDDLDGIIVNENSQHITIPREYLLNFLKDFEGSNLNKYDDYAFVMED